MEPEDHIVDPKIGKPEIVLQRCQQCPDGQQANPADLSLAHNFYFSLSFARPGRQSNLISPAVMPPRAQIRRRMFYCESVIDSQSVGLHKQMISDDIAGFPLHITKMV